MKDILNAAQTAKVIGCSPQMVREKIRHNIWPFGNLIPAKQYNRKKDGYEINKYALARWLEISTEEVDRRLNSEKN